MSAEDLERLWDQLARQVDTLTAQSARKATKVLPLDDIRVQVFFRDNFTLDWCSKPHIKQKLEAALTVLAARPLKIEVAKDASAPPAEKTAEATPVKSVRQRTRELMEHPVVKEAMNLFSAEIVEVREGRP